MGIPLISWRRSPPAPTPTATPSVPPAAVEAAKPAQPAAEPAAARQPAPTGPSAAKLRAAWSADYQQNALAKAAESLERGVVGGRNEPGKLVELAPGRPGKGGLVTVHGANGSPTTMAPFHGPEVARGRQVLTFAHDDLYRSQKNSAADLAGELRTWMAANPREPLELAAHCQGARIALGAMDILSKDGSLAGRDVKLNLITPPLQGLWRGAFAQTAPPGVGAIAPTVRPGKDMSPIGGYQRMLDGITLPPNVKTEIFVADRAARDGFVDPDHARFRAIAERLGARVHELPNTDHMSAVAGAAARR